MKSGITEIVHIIPLGQEFDRAVRPFDRAVVNMVYIIADSHRKKKDSDYAARVAEYLWGKHIAFDIIEANFADMADLLKVIASLIRQEHANGNTVYVNMSAAGEMAAVAATLAGMALKAEVYCVRPDRYASDAERATSGVSVCTKNVTTMLPRVDILLPDENELPILEKMYQSETYGLSASQISSLIEPDDEEEIETMSAPIRGSADSCSVIEYPENVPIEDRVRKVQRKVQSRNLMKVAWLMKRMEDKGYIVKSKSGRKMIYLLTERGMYATLLSGNIK